MVIDNEPRLFTCKDTDSHSSIRALHGIRECTGGLGSRLHTPVEFLPARGWFRKEDYDLVFDGGKPDWRHEEWTQVIADAFWRVIEPLIDGDALLVEELCIHDRCVKTLPALPKVRYLSVNYSDVTALPALPNVRYLSVSYSNVTALPALPKVRYLSVSGSNVTALPALPNVTHLSVSGSKVTALPALPEVKVLDVSYSDVTELPALPNVKVYR